GFPVGRPDGSFAVARDRTAVKDGLLVGAVALERPQIPERRIVAFVQEGKALAIGREGDGAIDITHDDARSAAENRSAVENGNCMFSFGATDEIDVVAVGREGEAEVAGRSGCDDLRVAAGGDVAKPKRL